LFADAVGAKLVVGRLCVLGELIDDVGIESG
jgi:hypothetical protein